MLDIVTFVMWHVSEILLHKFYNVRHRYICNVACCHTKQDFAQLVLPFCSRKVASGVKAIILLTELHVHCINDLLWALTLTSVAPGEIIDVTLVLWFNSPVVGIIYSKSHGD